MRAEVEQQQGGDPSWVPAHSQLPVCQDMDHTGIPSAIPTGSCLSLEGGTQPGLVIKLPSAESEETCNNVQAVSQQLSTAGVAWMAQPFFLSGIPWAGTCKRLPQCFGELTSRG